MLPHCVLRKSDTRRALTCHGQVLENSVIEILPGSSKNTNHAYRMQLVQLLVPQSTRDPGPDQARARHMFLRARSLWPCPALDSAAIPAPEPSRARVLRFPAWLKARRHGVRLVGRVESAQTQNWRASASIFLNRSGRSGFMENAFSSDSTASRPSSLRALP